MFNRDPNCYRMAPRTLSEAFGPYATFGSTKPKKVRSALAWIGYPIAGLVVGIVSGAVMYGLDMALEWMAGK